MMTTPSYRRAGRATGQLVGAIGVAATLLAGAVVANAAAGDNSRTGDLRSATQARGLPAAIGHDHSTHTHEHNHEHGRTPIPSKPGGVYKAAFDLVRTSVRREGSDLVFVEKVAGKAGNVRPRRTGEFAGSKVLSYVWPTTLDPYSVGFGKKTGILALAATSHPDFDDTPLYDEDADGDLANDGALWHAHWVVLVPDKTRADGALKVRDIPEGATPRLPETWPGAPIYLDSPPFRTKLSGDAVKIRLPLDAIGGRTNFRYDGVTAALRVNANLHDPLLRVTNVFDVASGDLSLPGTVINR